MPLVLKTRVSCQSQAPRVRISFLPPFMKQKQCIKCKEPKDTDEFYSNKNTCKVCDNLGRSARKPTGHPRTETERARDAALNRSYRLDPSKVARFILSDSRGSDKLRGFDNDLDSEWIKVQIAHGCNYCGAVHLRMTLDRIDNDLGHVKSNLVPACIRCNYLRRDMPYKAWLHIVPSLRSANSLGLYGDWTGRCR
jgi:hypothetical protein